MRIQGETEGLWLEISEDVNIHSLFTIPPPPPTMSQNAGNMGKPEADQVSVLMGLLFNEWNWLKQI